MTTQRPRIAINGFGRIGRALARIAARDPNCPFDLVAANDLADPAALAYLLRYDTVHGRFELPVQLDGDGRLWLRYESPRWEAAQAAAASS